MNAMKMTIENIFKYKTGLDLAKATSLSLEDEKQLVKKRTGRSLDFTSKKDSRRHGRGNPLLAKKRIRKMSYIDKRLESLDKRKK